jgi:hypothetical protein
MQGIKGKHTCHLGARLLEQGHCRKIHRLRIGDGSQSLCWLSCNCLWLSSSWYPTPVVVCLRPLGLCPLWGRQTLF